MQTILLLLASNPKSLQHNINILNNYCNDWHLKVNLKKTKIVTFSNSGRKCKHLFQYDDSVIENVSNYNYLGIKFTSSGTFTYAQKELVITNCNTTISFSTKFHILKSVSVSDPILCVQHIHTLLCLWSLVNHISIFRQSW